MGADPPTNYPGSGTSRDPPWASAHADLSLPIRHRPPTVQVAAKPRRRSRKRSWLGLVLLVLLLALGMWFVYQYATLPDARGLIDRNPETTALIQAREQAALSQNKRPRHRQYWVSLGSIDPRAVDAVIASEDASFYQHHGIDFDELNKVVSQAWEKGSLGRGASTITQQLAKNLWLSGERSLLRKAKELILARRLENSLPKKRILALYLNVVEWGDGVYGIEAGAREHFGTSASQLSVGQGAILAAMLPAPQRWTPERRSPALRKRALWIIDRLQESEKVSPEEGDQARSEIDRLLARDQPAPDPDEEPEPASEGERSNPSPDALLAGRSR